MAGMWVMNFMFVISTQQHLLPGGQQRLTNINRSPWTNFYTPYEVCGVYIDALHFEDRV